MENQLHTVLGASGAVGSAVLQELQQRGLPVRAVTNSSQIEGLENKQANLLNEAETQAALEGSSHIYLCVGLPYKTEVWKRDWESLMKNVIAACVQHQAKLIFLDNIYMYQAPLPLNFDENSPQNPSSEKGKARKKTADLMLNAMANGTLKGLIGRASDFYGKGAVNSSLYAAFLERMLVGKNPMSLTRADRKHTYAYVADLGKALVALALEEDCYGQVWHLPTGDVTSTETMVSHFNKALNSNFKLSVMPGPLRKLLSLFIGPIKEVSEMRYQFENDYVMSWQKFKTRFPEFETTPYPKAVEETVAWFQKQ